MAPSQASNSDDNPTATRAFIVDSGKTAVGLAARPFGLESGVTRSIPGGALVISLDLEMFWGVRDRIDLPAYQKHLRGEREAIHQLLDLFDEFSIRATWAAVGMLFFRSRAELLAALPSVRPTYTTPSLSAYESLDDVGQSEESSPTMLAASLIEKIAAHPGQEIGTHTFSHLLCDEQLGAIEVLDADLAAAHRAAALRGIQLRSIVFPRNQYNSAVLEACAAAGLVAYRGVEEGACFRPEKDRLYRRAGRLVDAYVNLFGHHTTPLSPQKGSAPCNVAQSRFLRPYDPSLRLLEPLRKRRITDSMRYAAEHGELFHLWWHPHNFGQNLRENMAFVRAILESFVDLRRRHGMISFSMSDAAECMSQ